MIKKLHVSTDSGHRQVSSERVSVFTRSVWLCNDGQISSSVVFWITTMKSVAGGVLLWCGYCADWGSSAHLGDYFPLRQSYILLMISSRAISWRLPFVLKRSVPVPGGRFRRAFLLATHPFGMTHGLSPCPAKQHHFACCSVPLLHLRVPWMFETQTWNWLP